MVSFTAGIDFAIGFSNNEIMTLDFKEISHDEDLERSLKFEFPCVPITYSKSHSDGWIIKAKPSYDYYVWVEKFEAFHPKYGRVGGDTTSVIKAKSVKALNHFLKSHQLKKFDLHDI